MGRLLKESLAIGSGRITGEVEKWLREREGGEWDLRSGNGWREHKVSLSEIGDIAVTEDSMKEEDGFTLCCCEQLVAVNALIIIFALINLVLVTTGCVGFTLSLVEYISLPLSW